MLKGRQQGQLDCLCGVYSIMNAVTELSPRLSQENSRQLFNTLCSYLEAEGWLYKVISEGCSTPLLSKMLHVAKDWLNVSQGKVLTWQKPFHKKTAATPDEVFSAVNEHLVRRGGTVIVGLDGKISHWTVASSVSSKMLHLLDSDGRKHIRRDLCVSHLETEDERFYWLYPSCVYLLELQ